MYNKSARREPLDLLLNGCSLRSVVFFIKGYKHMQAEEHKQANLSCKEFGWVISLSNNTSGGVEVNMQTT